MNNKKIKWILIFFLLILAAGLYVLFIRTKAVSVQSAKVLRGHFVETIEADGYFRSKNKYTVTAFSDGDIKRIDWRVGDVLKKNQTITELFWDVKYVPVKAPVNGVITKIYHESAGPVRRGDPIIEMIVPTDLEIVVELLTTDATRVKEGDTAFASGYGDDKPIQARVTKISKAGFIKVSALGVEEERTEVLMAPERFSLSDKTRLGHTFHTQVSIQIAKHENVLKIPVGALLRDGSKWAVFKIVAGKAKLTHITPGVRGNEEVVVAEGLQENDLVINYPAELIKNGTPIK